MNVLCEIMNNHDAVSPILPVLIPFLGQVIAKVLGEIITKKLGQIITKRQFGIILRIGKKFKMIIFFNKNKRLNLHKKN